MRHCGKSQHVRSVPRRSLRLALRCAHRSSSVLFSCFSQLLSHTRHLKNFERGNGRSLRANYRGCAFGRSLTATAPSITTQTLDSNVSHNSSHPMKTTPTQEPCKELKIGMAHAHGTYSTSVLALTWSTKLHD